MHPPTEECISYKNDLVPCDNQPIQTAEWYYANFSIKEELDTVTASDDIMVFKYEPWGGEWKSIDSQDNISIPSCKNGQIIVYENDHLTCIERGQPMYTFSSIFLIVVITIVVSKWIVPKINWKTAIKAFVHLIYRPGKKQVEEIKHEWDLIKK